MCHGRTTTTTSSSSSSSRWWCLYHCHGRSTTTTTSSSSANSSTSSSSKSWWLCADVFRLLQILARPDLAAAAIAAIPAAAATDPLAFCSSIVSRVSGIRLLPEAVVAALERVAALQGKGELENGDVKEGGSGNSSSRMLEVCLQQQQQQQQ